MSLTLIYMSSTVSGNFYKVFINPLTPQSDYHETSPYNIQTLISIQVMRRIKLIRQKLLS